MPDYQELYLKLFRATETAINTLIQAQRECEELYLSAPDPPLREMRPEKGQPEPDDTPAPGKA